MADNTENLTLKLLKEMRGDMHDMRKEMQDFRTEVNERFDAVDIRIDGVTHIMTFLAGRSHDHEERLEKLEAK